MSEMLKPEFEPEEPKIFEPYVVEEVAPPMLFLDLESGRQLTGLQYQKYLNDKEQRPTPPSAA